MCSAAVDFIAQESLLQLHSRPDFCSRMRFIIPFVFVSLIFCIGTDAESVDLKDSDFEARLSTYDTALVMFYAPW